VTYECTIPKLHETWSGTETIYTRPYLREFLESVSRAWEVVLWTTSVPERIAPVFDVIDPDRQLFHHWLARDASERKAACLLGRDPARCVLVDNQKDQVGAFLPDGGGAIYVPGYGPRRQVRPRTDKTTRIPEGFPESDLTYLPRALSLKRLEHELAQLATSDDIHGDIRRRRLGEWSALVRAGMKD